MPCTEQELERFRRYRERHPDRVRKASRESMRRVRADPERREKWLIKKRAWTAANREKCRLSGRKALCKKHGITLEVYDYLFHRQNGLCAICHNPEREKRGNFAIDHNHRCCPGLYGCGVCVRGLLCHKCNQALGCLRENPEIIYRAYEYITTI